MSDSDFLITFHVKDEQWSKAFAEYEQQRKPYQSMKRQIIYYEENIKKLTDELKKIKDDANDENIKECKTNMYNIMSKINIYKTKYNVCNNKLIQYTSEYDKYIKYKNNDFFLLIPIYLKDKFNIMNELDNDLSLETYVNYMEDKDSDYYRLINKLERESKEQQQKKNIIPEFTKNDLINSIDSYLKTI